MAASQTYAFDNDSKTAVSHHSALSGLLDQFSAERTAGLLELNGARCLEVGAGGGVFARWLADQVGPTGEVVATDIKPSHIPEHPSLRVLQHDVVNDPIEGTFDFVHARLLLNHLPARRVVLHKLASVLRPGGVLLTEDFSPEDVSVFVAYAPSAEDTELLQRYHVTHQDVLSSHRNTRTWSRLALGAMIEEGLTQVETVVYGRTWHGGDAGCRLLAAGLEGTRTEFVAMGMTDAELDRVLELFTDPRVILRGHPLYSTSGRR
jgi:2-polyprenyl-3-methyl-5-hydroxy-6-metoxy-1,4-benzoquinol methylase